MLKNRFSNTKTEKNNTMTTKHVDKEKETANEVAKMSLNFERLSNNDTTRLDTSKGNRNFVQLWIPLLISIFVAS